MHETPRKQSICPNCQHMLDETDNFCANCGQENTTKVVSFRTLVYEVVSDTVSWDSRWFQTVVPFLFKPGALTNEFIVGKRMSYMPPLRLYFFISVICFSIIAYYTAREDKNDEYQEQALKQVQADSIRNSVLKELPASIPADERKKIENALQKLTLVEKNRGLISNTNDNEKADEEENSTDSTAKTPVVSKKKPKEISLKKSEPDSTMDNEDDFVNNKKIGEWTQLIQMIDNPALSEDRIMDSLRWESNSWNRMKVNRARRLKNGNKEEFLAEMWDKAPVFMFILMPFMALVMKFLYIRRKRLYIEHLIFMLHIHSFAFFAIAIDMLLSNQFNNMTNASSIIIPLILVYFWVAFYKVYKQGWFRTSFKLFTFLFTYCFIFGFVAVLAVVVAAATY